MAKQLWPYVKIIATFPYIIRRQLQMQIYHKINKGKRDTIMKQKVGDERHNIEQKI